MKAWGLWWKNIFLKAILKLALHNAYRNGLIVELRYPSQMTVVCSEELMLAGQMAVVMNTTM